MELGNSTKISSEVEWLPHFTIKLVCWGRADNVYGWTVLNFMSALLTEFDNIFLKMSARDEGIKSWHNLG